MSEIEKLKSAYSILDTDDTAGAEILYKLIELLESEADIDEIAELFDFILTL